RLPAHLWGKNMAYPKTCSGALDAIQQMCLSGSSFSLKAYGHTADAYQHSEAGEYPEAIEDLVLACYDLANSTGYLAYNYDPWAYEGALHWYFTHCIKADDFNMDALLSVMLSADPEQVEYFVGLVDAYRQSIWNRPFNKDFYAALARGFMLWP
ncbi:unnamed protein product, partial [marine sediment metagenome]